MRLDLISNPVMDTFEYTRLLQNQIYCSTSHCHIFLFEYTFQITTPNAVVAAVPAHMNNKNNVSLNQQQ